MAQLDRMTPLASQLLGLTTARWLQDHPAGARTTSYEGRECEPGSAGARVGVAWADQLATRSGARTDSGVITDVVAHGFRQTD